MFITLLVYGTIGILWALWMIISMLDIFVSEFEIATCAILNFLFWPLSVILYVVKVSMLK